MSEIVEERNQVFIQHKNGDDITMKLHDEHSKPRTPDNTHEVHADPVESPAENDSQPARRPWLWAITGALTISLIGVGIAYYLHTLDYEHTDDAFIEAHVVPVSARVSGHVAAVLVSDNQLVNEGDLLAELDPADFATRLAAANATVDAAQATSKARNTGVAAAIADWEQAKADLVASEARVERADAFLRRIESLVPERAASQDTLDEAVAAAHVAHADVSSVKEKIKAKLSAIDQAKSAAKAAESGVEQAKAERNQATLNRSYTKVTAPISGYVTRKSVEAGAFIQVGQPLMAIVDPEVWVVANFKETQLTQMEPGQPVTVTVDTHPGVKFAAHIDSIQRGSGARFSLLPPENATGNYVKVVQRVPVKIVFNDLNQIKQYGLGPGMSVVPTVNISNTTQPSKATTGVLTSH